MDLNMGNMQLNSKDAFKLKDKRSRRECGAK
jgi:hypothetical protein